MDDDDDYVGRKSTGRAASHHKLVNINPEKDREIFHFVPVTVQLGPILGKAMKEMKTFTRSTWYVIPEQMAKDLHNSS